MGCYRHVSPPYLSPTQCSSRFTFFSKVYVRSIKLLCAMTLSSNVFIRICNFTTSTFETYFALMIVPNNANPATTNVPMMVESTIITSHNPTERLSENFTCCTVYFLIICAKPAQESGASSCLLFPVCTKDSSWLMNTP